MVCSRYIFVNVLHKGDRKQFRANSQMASNRKDTANTTQVASPDKTNKQTKVYLNN